MREKYDWFKEKLMAKSAVAMYLLYIKVSFHYWKYRILKKELPHKITAKFMDVSASIYPEGETVDDYAKEIMEMENKKNI